MDIKLNLPYYASIMLDAFKDLLCSKLCWHNRPGSSPMVTDPMLTMKSSGTAAALLHTAAV